MVLLSFASPATKPTVPAKYFEWGKDMHRHNLVVQRRGSHQQDRQTDTELAFTAMAIEYVTGLQSNHAHAGMLTTQSDVALLQDFAKGSDAATAAEAAAAVVRVVQDAASASGASPESVSAAQIALNDLCKNPQPDALPDLLTVCEYEVSFDIVDVFKLYSAAWKVVTTTCMKVTDGTHLPVPIRLRVLSSAMSGAQNMLLEVAQRSESLGHQHDNLNPLPALTRYLKIARFHCINAARCCKAFLKFEDINVSSEDQLVSLTSQVLRILGYVVYACHFNESVADDVRADMIQNISPALGGIMRSLLAMIQSFTGNDDDNSATRLISRALDALATDEEWTLGGVTAVSSHVVQILAIIHLLRLAASETSLGVQKENTQSELQGRNRCIFLCRQVLESTLLPVLFNALETTHAQLFASRELQTSLTFLDCISLLVEQCIALVDVQSNSRQHSTKLEDFLLVQMNTQSAVRALISHRSMLRIMAAHKEHSARQHRLFFAALTGARLSLSLGTGYAERRWIPLASTMALVLFKAGQELRAIIRLYQQARYSPASATSTRASDFMADAVILRVLSSLCGLLLSQGEQEAGPLLSPQRIHPGSDLVGGVLQSAGLDPAEVSTFVKRVVSAEHAGDSLAEAAIYLLPYLMDGRSSSDAAVACMKREDFSIQTHHRAINILNPALMSPSALQTACSQATALIQRFGSVMCAPVAAFVARASVCLHQNVSPRDWEQLSSLLELAISSFGTLTELEIGIDGLREATVMYHATHALKVTNALSHSMPRKNTQVTLPRNIMPQVEDAQARVQRWQGCQRMSDAIKAAATESSCASEEVAVCTRLRQKDVPASPAKASPLREFELLKQELLISARTMSGNKTDTSLIKAQAKLYVDELRDLVSVLERT